MSKKKIIITVVSLTVVAGLIGGGIGGYRWYQSKNLTADVQNVADLNFNYGGNEMSSSGMVTNDMSQNVPLLESQTIQEIFVKEGQTVAIGDQLMSYDMTLSDLQLEMKQLDIDTYHNKMEAAKRELDKLKKTVPIPETPANPPQNQEPSVPQEPTPNIPNPSGNENLKGPEKSGEAYNYISTTTTANKGTGTKEDPFIFLCTPECYVLGEYLNVLSADAAKPIYAVFSIHQNNVLSGALISEWKVSGISGLPKMEATSKWAVATKSQMPEEPLIEEPVIDKPMDKPIVEEPVVLPAQGYTVKELAKMISEKEGIIRDLDLNIRKAELQLEQMKKISKDGVVTATVNGIVKKVANKDNPPKDGSPFITVSGSEGLYVSGTLSELLLDQIKVGQVVFANSWESGLSFEATITEISTYPQENNNSYGDGNPNVSYYPYMAYIENTEGLKNGEYVGLTMTSNVDTSNVISLEKAYVREENGKSYVLKADKNDRLVKQYVETGKTLWGQSVEILSGLTLEDRVAFPYGKTAKEGIKVKEASNGRMG